MKNNLLPKFGALLVASVLFGGTARAALTANGLTINGLSSVNGMKVHNGLSSVNGMKVHNGLSSVNGMKFPNGGVRAVSRITARRMRLQMVRAALWTSNGINPGQPLSKSTLASRR